MTQESNRNVLEKHTIEGESPVYEGRRSMVVSRVMRGTDVYKRQMLGDTAVAVHPDDERYKDLVGKKCILPIMNKEIPIIAD